MGTHLLLILPLWTLLLRMATTSPFLSELGTTDDPSPHPLLPTNNNDNVNTSLSATTTTTTPNNLTAGAGPNDRLTCYPSSDPLFFSLMTTHYSFTNCIRTIPRFGNALSPTTSSSTSPTPSDINFWYTPINRKPLGLRDPAYQMPVYHNEDSCSVAIVSTKLLDRFARDQGIEWREEWGGREPKDVAPMVVTEEWHEVNYGDLWGLLDCFQPPGRRTVEGPLSAAHLISSEFAVSIALEDKGISYLRWGKLCC